MRPLAQQLAQGVARFALACLRGLSLMLLAVTAGSIAVGSAAERHDWLSGDELRRQLDLPVGIDWTGTPLRQALHGLAQAQRVAIVLDRRVDPDQKLELSVSNITLEVALKSIASREKLGVCQFGPIAYFGPEVTTRKLRTVAALRKEELVTVPAGLRAKLLRSRPWQWDDLATPRDLLAALATEADIDLQDADRVPHDLWPAADLPPLSWCDRLSLVAAQFDLTFQFEREGRVVRLVPFPETAVLERSYPVGSSSVEMAKKWSATFPNSQIKAAAGKVAVRGPLEDQELIEAAVHGRTVKHTTVTEGKAVYQLEVKNAPLGRLLKELGQKLQLDVRIDEAGLQTAGISLDTLVSLSVKDATADALLSAALDPAGLTFTRQGNVVEIRPAKK